MSSKNKDGLSYGTGRTRNYACVVYPDSAPDNWIDIISSSKIPVFISPFHNLDKNPNGEPKKPHYHVMIMYESVKTKEQAIEFIQSFGGVGCEVINSIRGYARYLTHKDNPEKVQYSEDDVLSYGGADYIHAIGTFSDKAKACREMIRWIEENDIISYRDLMDYASVNRSDWFDALINNSSMAMIEYIKSRYWQLYCKQD